MPTYTVIGNNKTNATTRAQAYLGLAELFRHAPNMAVTVSAVAINATSGVITVTMAQTLTADQRAHLGLA